MWFSLVWQEYSYLHIRNKEFPWGTISWPWLCFFSLFSLTGSNIQYVWIILRHAGLFVFLFRSEFCMEWPNWILHVPLLVWILFIKINWRGEWRWPLQQRKEPSLEISTLPIFVVLNMIGFLLTGFRHGRSIWFCDFDTHWKPTWFIVCQGRMDFSSIKSTEGLQPLMHGSGYPAVLEP